MRFYQLLLMQNIYFLFNRWIVSIPVCRAIEVWKKTKVRHYIRNGLIWLYRDDKTRITIWFLMKTKPCCLPYDHSVLQICIRRSVFLEIQRNWNTEAVETENVAASLDTDVQCIGKQIRKDVRFRGLLNPLSWGILRLLQSPPPTSRYEIFRWN